MPQLSFPQDFPANAKPSEIGTWQLSKVNLATRIISKYHDQSRDKQKGGWGAHGHPLIELAGEPWWITHLFLEKLWKLTLSHKLARFFLHSLLGSSTVLGYCIFFFLAILWSQLYVLKVGKWKVPPLGNFRATNTASAAKVGKTMFFWVVNQSSTIHPSSQRTSPPCLPAFIGGGKSKIETARCWKFKRFMVCASFVYATRGVKTLEETSRGIVVGWGDVVVWMWEDWKKIIALRFLFGCLFSAIFRIHQVIRWEMPHKKRRFFGESCLKPSGSYQPTTFALMLYPGRALGGGRNLERSTLVEPRPPQT